MLVSPAAFSAFQQQSGFARLVHVGHNPISQVIQDNGSDRNLNQQVVPFFSCAAVCFTVFPVLGGILAFEPEIQQRMHVGIRVDQDISAVTAVTSVRSAVDNKLFPVKRR